MVNIFENPKKYISEFIEKKIIPNELVENTISDYKGLSMMCVWITRKCPLSCENCFFKSSMNCFGEYEEENSLNNEGIDKLIKFINDSNSGYLMLSGGGDPFMCKEKLYRIIGKAKTKRIVVVTSGYWANNYQEAEKTIDELYRAYLSNHNHINCTFVLRLSIDSFHEKAMGGSTAFYNIINIFNEKYKNIANFILIIHTLMFDNTVENIAGFLGVKTLPCGKGLSDNCEVIKIVPNKAEMIFENGYKIMIGISKLFYSNLLVDLNDKSSLDIKNSIKVITEDMEMSEQDNPSFIQNTSGEKGLDFWVDYNGNITTWFNQDWEMLFNLYIDDYLTLVKKTFSYPITARFLKKGYQYRNSIVEEVNSVAVLRSKCINLRDYVSAIILEEDKTKLYYGLRVMQDYMREYYLTEINIAGLSDELQKFIQMDRGAIKEFYDESSYDILTQYLDENNFDYQKWYDLFVLIKLGHYEVSEEKLKKYFKIYMDKMNLKRITLDCFEIPNSVLDYQRFHQRISFIKKEALEYLKKR